MVMIVVMKEKQMGGKMRCGWGKLGREKAQLRNKWSILYAFQKYAKSVKETTIFDLDPRAERGTRIVGHLRSKMDLMICLLFFSGSIYSFVPTQQN